MARSLTNLLVHLVFSTKDRARLLPADIQPRVHAYLATVARNARCECYRVGGTEDHVHLALRLHRALSMSSLVEDLKTDSSRWIKTIDPNLQGFAWQGGYGAFSIGATELRGVMEYIEGQAEHHRKRSFQDEFRAILAEQGIELDERYLWD